MKKICLIFIIACLTEQLKADVYNVKPKTASRGDQSLATLDWDPDLIFTIKNDVKQGDIKKVRVFFYKKSWTPIAKAELSDPCNMDPSTEEGTLAAILWGALGIDSCPIAAGDYPMVKEFNQTGIIKDKFESINDLISINFNPQSQDGKEYFSFFINTYLVETDSSRQDDGENEGS